MQTPNLGSVLFLALLLAGCSSAPKLMPTPNVNAAGGVVVVAETDRPLEYNTKESLLNPFFFVRAN